MCTLGGLKEENTGVVMRCYLSNPNITTPAYVGMRILDLSKTLMYDFHYNYIKKKYNSKAKLLFTDTDSLTYEIETEDVYKDFWKDKNRFDNRNYPEESRFHDKTNKKIIGKFKDEACGVPITEFKCKEDPRSY